MNLCHARPSDGQKAGGGTEQSDGGRLSQSELSDRSQLAVSLHRRLCISFGLQPYVQGAACAGEGHMTCEQDITRWNWLPPQTFA